MSIEKAKLLFEKYVTSSELKLHCKEVSTIMKFLAKDFGEDAEKWEICGLLHDLDFDFEKRPAEHGKKTAEILKQNGYPADIVYAILSHNEDNLGVKRKSKMDFALSAADNVSGLIYAYALLRKSIEGIEPAKIRKRMKEKAFAAAVSREKISDIEKAGISLDKFIEVSIKAMQSIAKEIGF